MEEHGNFLQQLKSQKNTLHTITRENHPFATSVFQVSQKSSCCREIFTDTVSVQRTIFEFLTQKTKRNSRTFKCRKKRSIHNCSARVGTDDICALRFTERAKASIDVFGSDCKMIRGARLKLGQCAGHRQWKGLHLPNLLPVLL